MTRTGISRCLAIAVASMAALAAPAGAGALSTHSAAAALPPELTAHSASTSTPNSNGELVATAECGAGEHFVSARASVAAILRYRLVLS